MPINSEDLVANLDGFDGSFLERVAALNLNQGAVGKAAAVVPRTVLMALVLGEVLRFVVSTPVN